MTASTFGTTTIQLLAGTSVATTTVGMLAWTSPLAATNITAAVLFMALTGTAAGLLVNPPGGSRRRLFGMAFGYTVFAASLARVIPEFSPMAFLAPVQPPLALLLAFFAQSTIPALWEGLATRIKRTLGGTPQ